MKSVTQEHPLGCGVACVAFVTDVKYSKALKLFSNPKNAISGKCYCSDIVKALKKAGLGYNYCYAKSSKKKFSRLEKSIVFIKRSQKYPFGHFLVYSKGKWMNPWINLPKITPAKSGFMKTLPGKIQWIIYPEN